MPPDTVILAFDTSAAHCAAALVSGGNVIAESVEEMSKGQAERLFPMMEEMLAGAGIGWKDVGRIGVGIGPGNFTGIRISVAGARGLALSLGVPAIGVSAFDALGWGLKGKTFASVDARAGRIYLKELSCDSDPVLVDIDEAGAYIGGKGIQIIGHGAKEIALITGATEVTQPTPVAVAIAMIAAQRDPEITGRPAPLYIRAPDAAPPKEAAPVILP